MSRATTARGRLGLKSRHYPPDHPEILTAKAELAEAKLCDYIERTLAAAPTISDTQRRRIADLLTGGGAVS